MPQLHLIFGPVGAGKSTFARKLSHQYRAVPFILDDWMARLFGDDERPAAGRIEWYLERRDRCLEQIWALTTSLLDVGTSVVLELGLIRCQERAALYSRIDEESVRLTVYVLDAPREVRRARVLRRNSDRGETFAMEVPLEIFELASDRWEPPTADEQHGRDFRFETT